jgi:putative spermidine/putrescine transport system substrate-binding protein
MKEPIMFDLTRRNFLMNTVAAGGAIAFSGQAFAQGAQPAPPPARQTGQLIVNTYGGLYERHWRSQVLPAFTEQTGIKPVLDIGVGRIFAANLRASAANTPYSCVLMNENIAAQLRDEGMFEKITVDKVPNYADVLPNFKGPGDLGVVGLLGPIGIGYRTDLVKTKPKSWKDLWDNPEFKGKIGLYQIGAAGAHLFILMTAKIYGGSQDNWQVALQKIQQLQPFPQVDFSGALSTLMTRGDVIVAPIDAAEIISLKKKGVPVDMVAPEEGLMAFEVGWYLIKNAPAQEEAYKFLNFILDPKTQQQFTMGISGILPANGKTVIPDTVKAELPIPADSVQRIVKWDWSRTNKQMPEITDAWNRTIK